MRRSGLSGPGGSKTSRVVKTRPSISTVSVFTLSWMASTTLSPIIETLMFSGTVYLRFVKRQVRLFRVVLRRVVVAGCVRLSRQEDAALLLRDRRELGNDFVFETPEVARLIGFDFDGQGDAALRVGGRV